MAVFNPDVPDQQTPSFIGYSKGYDGDKSLGIALSGAGDLLKNTVTVADESIKQTIDRALYDKVDLQRESFTGALENIAGIPMDKRVGDIQPSGTALNILPTEQKEVPKQLDAQLDKVGSLTAASNTGKLSPIYYTGRLDMIAKDLRSQYPGYREYIDTKISGITGGNPANEYMKELLSGINTALTNNKSELEKAKAFVLQNSGVPGAAQVQQALDSNQVGNPMSFVTGWASKYKSIEYDQEMRKNAREDWKGSRDVLVTMAKADTTKMAWDEFTHSFGTFDKSVSLTIGGKKVQGASLEDLAELVNKAQKGEIKVTDEEGKALSSAFMAMKTSLFNRIKAKANVAAKNGSLTELAGAKEVDEIINSQLSSLDQIAKDIDSKDYGAAYRNFNANRAIVDDTSNGVLNSVDFNVREYARRGSVANKLFGPNAVGQLIQTDISDGIVGKIQNHFQTIYNDERTKASLQENEGQPYTMRNILDNLRKATSPQKTGGSVTTPGSPNALKTLSKDLVNVPGRIMATGDDRLATNIAKAAFDPKNRGFTAEFKDDTVELDTSKILVDNVTGTVTSGYSIKPGSHMTFDRMTTPQISARVFDLSQKGEPELWENYKSWVANEHRVLFQKDMLDLNSYGKNPNIVLSWNSENPGWTVRFKSTGNAFADGVRIEDRVKIQGRIAMVNSGIRALVDIAKKENTDPNAFVLRQMLGEGVDPKGQGIPSGMFNAIMNSRPPKEDTEGSKNPSIKKTAEKPVTLEELSARSKNTADNSPMINTAKDFLRDPLSAVIGKANAATTSPEWGDPLKKGFAKTHITEVKTPGGIGVRVNKVSAEAFQGFLTELEASGYKINDIGGHSLRMNKSDPRMLSQHAFGNAIDINPDKNPFGSRRTDMPPNVAEMAAKYGIRWGGTFTDNPDPMHFEYVGKPK